MITSKTEYYLDLLEIPIWQERKVNTRKQLLCNPAKLSVDPSAAIFFVIACSVDLSDSFAAFTQSVQYAFKPLHQIISYVIFNNQDVSQWSLSFIEDIKSPKTCKLVCIGNSQVKFEKLALKDRFNDLIELKLPESGGVLNGNQKRNLMNWLY